MAEFERSSGRDTRLLALVILVALVVLIVLARFRFPAADTRPATVGPGPLERLAARAVYDDLASAVQATIQRIAPYVVAIDLEAAGQAPGARRTAGIRLRPDLAVAAVPAGWHAAPASDSGVMVRATDEARGVALVVATRLAPGDRSTMPADLPEFSYVCAVEAAAGGLTAAPVFLGRLERVTDDRWGGVVFVPSGGTVILPEGALLFLFDGRFAGLVTSLGGEARAIVPIDRLDAFLAGLAGGAPPGNRP